MAGERTRTVSVRLSPAEHAVWVAAARGAGRSRLGSWVRDRVTATLSAEDSASSGVVVPAGGGATRPGVSAGEWAGLRAELGRVGNNLNQAVRVTNASGVNPARVAEMADAAQGVRFVVAGLLAAVRAATGGGPVGVPVVGSRSVGEQLAEADAERRFEERVRVAAERLYAERVERLYAERVERNRAVLAERVAARRAAEAAAGEPAGGSPVGEPRVGESRR